MEGEGGEEEEDEEVVDAPKVSAEPPFFPPCVPSCKIPDRTSMAISPLPGGLTTAVPAAARPPPFPPLLAAVDEEEEDEEEEEDALAPPPPSPKMFRSDTLASPTDPAEASTAPWTCSSSLSAARE